MTAESVAARLRKPFPTEQIGKLPRVTCPKCSDKRNRQGTCDEHPRKERCQVCNAWVSPKHIHIDYVGHGDVTSRLLEADPEWNWEPVATDEHGVPVFDTDDEGLPVGLWIRLTVGGMTRLGYGSVPSGQHDAVKVLIGDALRNAAMRFGVALDLWAKGDRADPTAENATASAGQAQRRRPQQQRGNGQQDGDSWEKAKPASRNGQQDWRHPPPRPASELPRNTDGSLSRSRITDEELAAAGVMTSDQQKEHTELRKGAVTGKPRGTVERAHGPDPGDEWASGPDGQGEDGTDRQWYAGVEAEIKKFTTDDYGEVLRRRVMEKVEAGGCTKEDGEKLRTLIRARRQSLTANAEAGAVDV